MCVSLAEIVLAFTINTKCVNIIKNLQPKNNCDGIY